MHQCAIIVVVGHFQNCLNPNRYKQIYKFGRIEHLTFMIFIIFIYSLNIQNYEALFDVGRRDSPESSWSGECHSCAFSIILIFRLDSNWERG